MRPGSARFPLQGPAPLWRWFLACTALALGAAAISAAHADGPPSMEYQRLYGRVLADNAALEPQVQPIIAIVGGIACGSGTTSRAEAPPEDAGQTVYIVQVLKAGTGAGERPGCGTAGAPVTLYFPLVGRIAQETPAWSTGTLRADLTLTTALPHRRVLPALAADGTP